MSTKYNFDLFQTISFFNEIKKSKIGMKSILQSNLMNQMEKTELSKQHKNTLEKTKLSTFSLNSTSGIVFNFNNGNDKIEFCDYFEFSFINIGEYLFNGSVKVLEGLGEGAQAIVYKGLDEKTNTTVAIKHFVGDKKEENIADILMEYKMVQNLDNLFITKYYQYELTDNSGNIMMQLSEMNLSKFMQLYPEERIPKNMTKKITKAILGGGRYGHSHFIIHRDLKPENILLSKDGTSIKGVDFGVSKIVGKSQTWIKREIIGTPQYMSPEVKLNKEYVYDCDIWSLGCIVFECFSGMKPYASKDLKKNDLIHQLVQCNLSSPLEVADEDIQDIFYERSNRDILNFLGKCWRGNNKFRPNAEELLEDPFVVDVVVS